MLSFQATNSVHFLLHSILFSLSPPWSHFKHGQSLYPIFFLHL
nr:MAG TPA: hypothetical protein [Caudoviricetes sp.]